MSEEIEQETTTAANSDAAPPASESVSAQESHPPQSSMTASPEHKSGWRRLVAPAWFLLGVLVGLGAFFAITQLTARPAPAPTATLDEATVRKAARDGLIEAIQALQAQSGGQASEAPKQVTNDAFAIRAANRLGDEKSKVLIVEYADFQCPFCGRYHTQVEPTIRQQYIDTGKATFVFKHMAFLGPESVYAAVASECAADQGKFWQYHDYLFEHQNGENQGAFDKDKLIGFAEPVGLDKDAFAKCVNSDATLERVKADTMEGQALGVSSTPTFFINGKPVVGLASPQDFSKLIDAAVNE